MKKILTILLIMSITMGGVFANGSTEANTTGKRQVVNFWYLWGGQEAGYLEQIIKDYNESQDTYEVVGLSSPDQRKIVTAISGGNGPDISDDFGSSVPKYATEQIAEPLDSYLAADGIVPSDMFVKEAFKQQQYLGKTYALPISVNVFALYYNKTILDSMGIQKLPDTLEELEMMAHKTTKVENGIITTMGSPLVPTDYFSKAFTYANGGNFGTTEKLTPDTPAFRKTLAFLQNEVETFGASAMNDWVSSTNPMRNTLQDPFVKGSEVFRIDGPWFYNLAKEGGVNFGVMPLPGAEATGENGWTSLETSMFYIPSTAKNKNGAWDFLKYLTMGEGAKQFALLKGDLPAKKALLTDSDLLNASDSYKVYFDIISANNMVSMPAIVAGSVYTKNINDAMQNILLGDSVDSTMAQVEKAMNSLN